MKIRQGFVSNSSSSSFIIGIANATKAGRDDIGGVFDPEKSRYSSYYGYLVDLGDDEVKLFANDDGTYRLTVDSFDNTSVSCIAVPGDKIVVLYGTGPTGDSFFSEYNDNGEWTDIDYDKIDFEDFDEKDQEKASLIRALGGDYTYGAGRNG